jgi:transcription elongation factor GreA
MCQSDTNVRAILPTMAGIEATQTPQVEIGSAVTFRDELDGEVERYEIVLPHDADLWSNRISAQSPFGNALLGRRCGERVRISTPGGVRIIRVLCVSPA